MRTVHKSELNSKEEQKPFKIHVFRKFSGWRRYGRWITCFYFAEESGVKVSFAFKAVKAEFLKRAMSDVYFNSDEGQLVKQAFDEAMSTKERVNKWIKVEAKNTDNEIVAVFEMEISVKVKS